MGPFALMTAALGLAPFVFEPALHRHGLMAAVTIASAVAFHLVAAIGLSIGYARLHARDNGVAGGLGRGLIVGALARAPRMLAILVMFSIACVLPFTLFAAMAGSGEYARFGDLWVILWFMAEVGLVGLCGKLMSSAVMVVVEKRGVLDALRESWRRTEGATWALWWRTAAGIFVSFVGIFIAACVAAAVLDHKSDGVIAAAATYVIACGVILPLDAVFVYAAYRNFVRDR